MSKADYDQLTDHEYDGIREYDNPTPGWWHLIFLGCVVFSMCYYVFWEMSPVAPDIHEMYASAEIRELKKKLGDVEPGSDAASILRYTSDDEKLKIAEATFKGNCASCHGSDGQGMIGPNLTDDAYKNVKTIEDIYTVIAKGAAAQAMPAWENRFDPREILLLSSYVATLRGKNLTTGRGPEGEVIPPWPEPPPPGAATE